MDGFTEKKWFVYLGDHHEGPFSLEEIQSKMQYGQLSSTNYVWAEGMSDWKLMSEVQAFESILLPVAPPPVEATSEIQATRIFSAGPELAPILSSSSPSGFSAISIEPAVAPVLESAGPAILADHTPEVVDASSQDDVMKNPDHKKALAAQMVKIAILLMAVAGIGIAYNDGYLTPLLNSQFVKHSTQSLMNAADPVLTSLGISPIPKLDDVDADEYEQLKSAARAKIDQAGPQIAIALSKTNPLSPTFYVGTNLPDGTILDIYVEGIGDSLLNQLSFNAKTQVAITKKFGKSLAPQFPQGTAAFPRGEYVLYVVDPETQPADVKPLIGKMSTVSTPTAPISVPKGLRVIATKSYFLGGFKDATYTARLQEYHAKLTAKAQQELTELKQIAGTFESQLASTSKKFAALKKGRRVTPAQKKAWATFHTQWTALNEQLGQSFSNLTADAIQNNYFYGFLYQMSQQVGDKLNALHTLQASYFAGTVADPKAYEIQLGEASSIARSSIDELKAKIGQIENLPPTPNGLPKRDGI